MPRELTVHKANGCNDALKIEVMDEPGSGGACHEYRISGFVKGPKDDRVHGITNISFQNGPIPEVGTNGLTHEALLAIIIDRLEKFQEGSFACSENKQALFHANECLYWLQTRTLERQRRGVEGTHQH